MSNQTKAKKLLQKYLDGTASEQERAYVEAWYQSYEKRDVHLNDFQQERLQEEIKTAIDRRTRSHKWVLPGSGLHNAYKIAAAVILPLVCGAIFFFLLPYLHTGSEALQYLTVNTKAGERKQVQLSDGTLIWLNGESTLTYPQEFSSAERLVTLEKGEAFFKVKRNEQSPFIVTSPSGVKTKVLGTSFNISLFKTGDTKVSVETGKVAVSNSKRLLGLLEKGKQVIYNSRSGKSYLSDSENTNSWIDGKIDFKGNSLAEVAEILERNFGKKIELSQGVPSGMQCTGNFSVTDTPEQIMSVICSLHHLQFKSTANSILISK